MIQVTFQEHPGDPPSVCSEYFIAPIDQGSQFLRDMIPNEVHSVVLDKVKSGEWRRGIYSIYSNGVHRDTFDTRDAASR